MCPFPIGQEKAARAAHCEQLCNQTLRGALASVW